MFTKWFLERKLFAPHKNIWNFDLGKLVVPEVSMVSDLLTIVALNYDLVARMVRRIDGECLMKIIIQDIQEVFRMEPTADYHEVINFQGLEKEYLF